jgi:hypothetical protein
MKTKMERTSEAKEFSLPLELQFAMRKAELQADEMTWEQLHYTLLSLYHQRLMEWQSVKDILESENIKIEFDAPTDLELVELAAAFAYDDEDDDDEDEDREAILF